MGTTNRDISIYYSYSTKEEPKLGEWFPPNGIYLSTRQDLMKRFRSGVGNPMWRTAVAEGRDATTPMEGRMCTSKASPTIVYSKHNSTDEITGQPIVKQYWCSGMFLANYFASTVWPNWTTMSGSAEGRAANRFLKEVRAAQTKMQGLVFLGELRETIRMLQRPASALQDRLGDYLNAARKAKDKHFRGSNPSKAFPKWQETLGGLWLEHAFGWQPLIHDIQDAKDAFNDLHDKERVIHISKGGREVGVVLEDIWEAYPGGCGWLAIYITRRITQTETVRFRGAVRATAVTTVQDRYKRWGLTPDQFVPTAWELLPWSFLVDYFASIGDFLDGTTTNTSMVTWSNRTRRQEIVQEFIGKAHPYPTNTMPGGFYTAQPGSMLKRDKRVIRDPWPVGAISPAVVFKIPGFKNGQVQNILGLLGSAGRDVHPQRFRR